VRLGIDLLRSGHGPRSGVSWVLTCRRWRPYARIVGVAPRSRFRPFLIVTLVLVAGISTSCGGSSASSSKPTTTPPATGASATASSSPTTLTAPTTTAPTAATTTTLAGEQLPISTESDTYMKEVGNDGPSSSILLPTSCELTGTSVTARGMYTNGGFVPNVYNRYGDYVVLYVFSAASPGESQGIMLGVSSISPTADLGTRAPWQVSLSIEPGLTETPVRCVVAAQPTHDFQGAP